MAQEQTRKTELLAQAAELMARASLLIAQESGANVPNSENSQKIDELIEESARLRREAQAIEIE